MRHAALVVAWCALSSALILRERRDTAASLSPVDRSEPGAAAAAAAAASTRPVGPLRPEPAATLMAKVTSQATEPPETTTEPIICQPQTPCKWAVYNSRFRFIELNLTNTYCVCGPGLSCVVWEDETSSNLYSYRCRLPAQEQPTPAEVMSSEVYEILKKRNERRP